MQSIITLASIALLAATGASAAPTRTIRQEPTSTVTLTGVTHTVVAGRGGLKFEPDNVVAEIGDVVEYHFLPKNHSVVQSSFGSPCQPLEDGSGFSSGFNFATAEGQSANVFQIVVENKTPVWYYCSQTNGNHCQNGMTGVINQKFDSPDFTLAKHRELAVNAPTSVTPAEQRGAVLANPNPLAGV
jgi:plastocyanin